MPALNCFILTKGEFSLCYTQLTYCVPNFPHPYFHSYFYETYQLLHDGSFDFLTGHLLSSADFVYILILHEEILYAIFSLCATYAAFSFVSKDTIL